MKYMRYSTSGLLVNVLSMLQERRYLSNEQAAVAVRSNSSD